MKTVFNTVLASLIVFIHLPSKMYGQKTDLSTYTIPAPPSLPAAGGKFTDPTFGTVIMRVTDATTCPTAAWHDYSYYDVFNLDNTRIMLECTAARYWYDFDPVAFTLGTRHTFPVTPHGDAVSGDGTSIWSSLLNNTQFVVSPLIKTIWSLNLDTGTYTTVKAFSPGELPAGATFINHMLISRDDNVFSFNTDTGCFAWKRSTNTVLYTLLTTNLDECQVDKTGLWLTYKPDSNPGDGTWMWVVNLINSTVVKLLDASVDWSPHHSDSGRAKLLGMNGFYSDGGGGGVGAGARIFRTLATPHTWNQATPGTTQDGHISFRADNEERVTMEWYYGGVGADPGGQLHGEVWAVYPDGSYRLERYCHHQSIADAVYRAQPVAVMSRDSQYAAYNSNNGVSLGRTDVFIVRSARRTQIPSSGMGAW